MKIKELKSFLEKVIDKDIDKLSSDYNANELNKKQIGLILEVATFLYGKDKFTKKQLTPFISEANVWFVLEKLRRTGLIKVDDKGVSHRTRLGNRVNKYMEKNEPKKAEAQTTPSKKG